MANYRQIHVSIWKDEWMLDLDPLEKLLFIYLFSNESTNLAGIYKIAFKVICFETGLKTDFVEAALKKFADQGKVYYDNGIVWVVNLRKYHATTSPKVLTRIQNELANIPDCPLKIRYLYHIDTLLLKEEKEDKSKEDEGGFLPTAKAQAIFANITGMVAIPGNNQGDVIEKICGLYKIHKKDTQEYLQPFYDAWTKTRGKDGRYYSKLNTSWLDWAIAGQIPEKPDMVKAKGYTSG